MTVPLVLAFASCDEVPDARPTAIPPTVKTEEEVAEDNSRVESTAEVAVPSPTPDFDTKTGKELFELYQRYRDGFGGEKDLQKAWKYLTLAADKEYPDAFATVGMAYFHGNYGLTKDLKIAAEFIRKGADAGSIEGICLYGQGCLIGAYGEHPDIEKARHYLTKAVAAGSGEAFSIIAGGHYKGYWGEVDIEKAKEYYKKAIDHGHQESIIVRALVVLEHPTSESKIETAIAEVKRAATIGDKTAVKLLPQLTSFAATAEVSLNKSRRANLPTCSEWMSRAQRSFEGMQLVGMHPRGIPVEFVRTLFCCDG